MTDFVLLLIGGCVWCFGIFAIVKELFFKEIIGFDLDKKWDILPYWVRFILKPLFACPYCMASIHGTYIAHYGQFYYNWYDSAFFAYIICLCGLNFIVKSILFPEYE